MTARSRSTDLRWTSPRSPTCRSITRRLIAPTVLSSTLRPPTLRPPTLRPPTSRPSTSRPSTLRSLTVVLWLRAFSRRCQIACRCCTPARFFLPRRATRLSSRAASRRPRGATCGVRAQTARPAGVIGSGAPLRLCCGAPRRAPTGRSSSRGASPPPNNPWCFSWGPTAPCAGGAHSTPASDRACIRPGGAIAPSSLPTPPSRAKGARPQPSSSSCRSLRARSPARGRSPSARARRRWEGSRLRVTAR